MLEIAEAEKMFIRALQGYEETLGPELVSSYIPALNTMYALGDLFSQTDRDKGRWTRSAKERQGEAEPLIALRPVTATLQARADALRAALKDYERAFAAQHNGRKPAKDDIKADAEVAAKYREYNKNHQGDLLQYLAATPTTGSRARHSRTPISEGRKFMLSQFFATPSTVRYQQIIHTGETPETKEMVKTRLKNGGDGKEAEEEVRVKDETPRCLKRTASFKDRLLSVSSSSSSMPGRSEMLDNERLSRTGPVLVTVKAKASFQPKPLTKSKAKKGKGKKNKTNNENENETDGVDGEIRTYDPNAVSHMNFKSLKIKNKNSKAKFRGRGGARFGRARHR
ncbi:hypothetical protein DV736_g830, partial [Chaetothyriales sp. CBS 134916]